MDVQVREMLRYIVANFAYILGFFFINDRLKGNACGLNHLGIGNFEVVNELRINSQIVSIQYTTTHQFKKHASRGLNVSGSIVSIAKLLAKEDLVELFQARQLELAALTTRQLAKLSSFLGTGIHLLPVGQRVLAFLAQELAAKDTEVEINVMTHKTCRFRSRL